MTDIGKGLSEQLLSLGEYRTINLIGHSMGGNAILISLMFTKFARPNAHELLSTYHNIILLGTPVEGSDLANLAWLVSNDPQLIALKPIAENELPVLTELAMKTVDEKRNLLGYQALPVSAAYEEIGYLGHLIVTQKSATAVAEYTQGFQKNHQDLVKPSDRNDLVYKWVIRLVNR